MAYVPGEVQLFLLENPTFQLSDCKKIKCTLTGHELPCRLSDLEHFMKGKKFMRLSKFNDFAFSRFEPHIVPSTKNPNQMFCKLTLRHMSKDPRQIQNHVQGKRYQSALAKFEECQKQGVEYVPACLLQKKQQKRSYDERPMGKKEQWEPSVSDSEDSDSGDSMSDLYPDHMFTQNNTTDDQNGKVKSSSDEEGMEVDSTTAKNKRQQKQNGGAKKKFKNHHQKPKNPVKK
ncbi:surfeit locus protein 2 [Pelodytes ibericus]